MYSDQTGQFLYLSSKGNRYIMVAYHTDANYIFMEPMKNRTELQMIAAYQRISKRIIDGGLGVKKHILDNEMSEGLKEAIKKNGVTHEVPPGKQPKTTSLEYWWASTTHSRCICGAAYSGQKNGSSIC